MMGRTHLIGGVASLWLPAAVLAVAGALPVTPESAGLAALGSLLGSLLPDLDAKDSLLKRFRVIFPRNNGQFVKRYTAAIFTEAVRCSVTERRVFTEEFKREAVRLAKERGNLVQTARELGLHETVLQRWKKRLEATPENERPFPGKGNARDEEMDKLRRELARVKEENEILKKAVGIFTSRPA